MPSLPTPVLRFTGTMRAQLSFQTLFLPQCPQGSLIICHQAPQLHDCRGVFWIPAELTEPCPRAVGTAGLGGLSRRDHVCASHGCLPSLRASFILTGTPFQRLVPCLPSQHCSFPVTDCSAGLAYQTWSPPTVHLATQTPQRIEWPSQAISKMDTGIWI